METSQGSLLITWSSFTAHLQLWPYPIKHPIDRIMILEHRDCGAYKKFFGLEWAKVLPPVETDKHLEQVRELSAYLTEVFHEDIPNLKVDSFLLARDEDDPLHIDPQNA